MSAAFNESQLFGVLQPLTPLSATLTVVRPTLHQNKTPPPTLTRQTAENCPHLQRTPALNNTSTSADVTPFTSCLLRHDFDTSSLALAPPSWIDDVGACDVTSEREGHLLKRLRKTYMAQKARRLTKYKDFPLGGANELKKHARLLVNIIHCYVF